ncbi:MAG: MBL fold metallo-hydrolase [Clostridia bacterium]|nr:MBL fold metallo-hydrolase [Clostridia bacterium]
MLNKKLLSMLLVLVTVLALLTGCGDVGETPDTTADTSASATETTAAPAPEVPAELNIVTDGKAVFKLIRDEDASASGMEVEQARVIMDQVKSLTGATMGLGTDWVKRGSELDSTTYEILVGVTAYPETQEVISSLGYGDWAVRLVGNKIVVFGFDRTSLSQATSKLVTLMKEGASADGKSLVLKTADLNMSGTKNEKLNALPGYEGGNFYAYYAAGAKCDEIIIRDTNVEQYNAYLKKLDAAGFKCYTTNEIAGNYFATYTNDKYTVTAGYYDYETSARLLIEPLAPAVGLKEENVYTPITTSQITMLGVEYAKSDGSYASNGLSVLIRLTDGRFVIVDGAFNTGATAKLLVDAMKEQSAAYAKSTSDITIAAWIVTHAHGDHYGSLLGQTSYFKEMNVERILVNFLSESERQKAISAYSGNWSSTEGQDYRNVPAVAKALGAEVHQVHVGQVYYLADLKMEILYTIESFAPNTCNALNTSSTVMRMEFDGKTTYMSTGDATGYGMEICADMFGDYIQSDIVQVCHHGYTTWGDDAGMIEAYKTINAPTVLWPQGLSAYPNYKGKSYNAVLFEVPNYKEVYVSGARGDQIIVPLPYTVGTAIEKRANG